MPREVGLQNVGVVLHVPHEHDRLLARVRPPVDFEVVHQLVQCTGDPAPRKDNDVVLTCSSHKFKSTIRSAWVRAVQYYAKDRESRPKGHGIVLTRVGGVADDVAGLVVETRRLQRRDVRVRVRVGVPGPAPSHANNILPKKKKIKGKPSTRARARVRACVCLCDLSEGNDGRGSCYSALGYTPCTRRHGPMHAAYVYVYGHARTHAARTHASTVRTVCTAVFSTYSTVRVM